MKTFYELQEAIESYTLYLNSSVFRKGESSTDYGLPATISDNYPPQTRFIRLRRSNGGAAGGSCWGDEPVEFSGRDEIDFDDFDSIFKFLEIKKPESKGVYYALIEGAKVYQKDNTEYEYYGNFTRYEDTYLNFEVLYICISNLPIWHKFPHPDPIYVQTGYHQVKFDDGSRGILEWSGNDYVGDTGIRKVVEYSPLVEPE